MDEEGWRKKRYIHKNTTFQPFRKRQKAEVALQIAQILLLQSVLSQVPTMGMDDISKTAHDGDAYSCVLQTADVDMQWNAYFPHFFVGIMILATMAWIAYTLMSSTSKCLETRGMDDEHHGDVQMTDVSGNETVDDVENKLLDTISNVCAEMETVSTEDVIRVLFQLRTMYHAVLSDNIVLMNVCKRAIQIGDNGIISHARINDASDLQGETLEIEMQNLVRFMTRRCLRGDDTPESARAENVLKQLLEVDVSAVLAKQMENFGDEDEESEEARIERCRHLRLEESSDPGFWMQQHHHEEESMSDDDDPMGLDGQQQDERIQPTEEDMAASVERA